MKIRFHIPLYLQPFASGMPEVSVSMVGSTVGDALAALFGEYPALRDRVMTEQGKVRQHINVFIGDESIRYTGGLQSVVTDGLLVTILPAVSGGR